MWHYSADSNILRTATGTQHNRHMSDHRQGQTFWTLRTTKQVGKHWLGGNILKCISFLSVLFSINSKTFPGTLPRLCKSVLFIYLLTFGSNERQKWILFAHYYNTGHKTASRIWAFHVQHQKRLEFQWSSLYCFLSFLFPNTDSFSKNPQEVYAGRF